MFSVECWPHPDYCEITTTATKWYKVLLSRQLIAINCLELLRHHTTSHQVAQIRRSAGRSLKSQNLFTNQTLLSSHISLLTLLTLPTCRLPDLMLTLGLCPNSEPTSQPVVTITHFHPGKIDTNWLILLIILDNLRVTGRQGQSCTTDKVVTLL